jgi:hypothetical protein
MKENLHEDALFTIHCLSETLTFTLDFGSLLLKRDRPSPVTKFLQAKLQTPNLNCASHHDDG